MKETHGRNYTAYTPVCICSKCGSEYDFVVSKILTECPECHEDFDNDMDQASKNKQRGDMFYYGLGLEQIL